MSDAPPPTIDRLPEVIAALPPHLRALADRLFQVVATEGEIVPPPEMNDWLARTFGSVEATLHQRIIRVMNRWTFEGATFNALRSRRPGSGATQKTPQGAQADPPELRERIERTQGDDFCQPQTRTPADTFGRVRGQRMITASNVAKAEGWHGVAVFNQHDPLALDGALVADLLDVVSRWAGQARQQDADARYLFTLWNCLWRAGASLVHGHAQMTLSHTMAHGRVELWRAAMARYHAETGGDYFADLRAVYTALGLATTSSDGDKDDAGGAVFGYASLTPAKEREVTLLAPNQLPGDLSALAVSLWRTLEVATRDLGVRAFNVAVFGPPYPLLDGASDPDWVGFPLVARFVDRGAPLAQTADIAALELFGSSVISSDPFEVARAMR